MSDDPDARQAQSKFDQPAVSGPAPTSPTEAATSAQDAVPAEAPDVEEHPAQVKAVPGAPFVAVPAAPPVPAPPVPAPPVPAPTVPAPPAAVPAANQVDAADASAEDSADDEAVLDGAVADDEAKIPLTFADRLRRLSPALVILSILSIGSLAFLAFALTSHTTPVPVLLSSAVVTGLAFAVDATVASFMTWRAGQNGEGGKALLLALIGGMSAVVAAGAFAGTLILALLLKG